jgi:hypothetical protein
MGFRRDALPRETKTLDVMRRHTNAIRQTDDAMEFAFPGYRLVVDFGNRFPRLQGAWQPAALFCLGDLQFLLLKSGDVGAFWLLDSSFELVGNDHCHMQGLLRGLLDSGVQDRALILELDGLISFFGKNDQAAFDALFEVCQAGGLQDAESCSALVETASRLGRLGDALPLVEPMLDRPGFLTPAQAAIPQAWLARACADRLDFARAHTLLAAAIAGSVDLPDWTAGLIDWCVRQDATAAFGNPPGALQSEAAAFGKAALDFLAGRPCNWRPGRYPTGTVARHWVRRHVRTIHLEPDDAGAAALLRAGGISPVFLQALLRGRDGVREACFAASSDVPFAADPALSLRVKEVAAAVLLGGKPVLCPFTGERALARDTINLHTFLHRKDGRACIIFSDPDISLAPSDSAWFFPDLGILLTFGWNMRPETDLATTMQRVLANMEAVQAHLAAPERVVMVSEEGMGHIGHYVWNVLSGWGQLFGLVDARDIGVLTSYRSKHFFGGVTGLYADEVRPIAHVLTLDGPEDAFATMLKHRGLALTLRDRTVTEDLARRVLAWCKGHVSSEFLHALAGVRRAAEPLVMLTLRCENRAWIEQESGFVQIINRLAAEHPRLGVVIDGLNAPPPGTTTFAPMSMEEEHAMAERVAAACPAVPIVNAIGCTPAESVLWCSVIDAFAAPIGAGLAKSRWIANKPGVGFSNRTFLEDGHFEGYLYSHFREAPSAMLYVAREDVVDADEGHHGMVGRANFSMDWQAPLARLRTLLTTAKQDAAPMTA